MAKEKIIYNGFELDSSEELYYMYFLDELKELNYIIDYKFHPESFELSDRVALSYTYKSKEKESFIFHPHIYTCDFEIKWNRELSYNLFYSDIKPTSFPFIAQADISYIDTKGTFAGNHNISAMTFPLNQKWVWQKYGIYINKTVVPTIFKDTFTPHKYLFTDKSKQLRKIKFKPITLSEFIKSKTL